MHTLEEMGYNLYASRGTADFYSEHGVKVCYVMKLFGFWVSVYSQFLAWVFCCLSFIVHLITIISTRQMLYEIKIFSIVYFFYELPFDHRHAIINLP